MTYMTDGNWKGRRCVPVKKLARLLGCITGFAAVLFGADALLSRRREKRGEKKQE